jgi:bacterioferritin (cytochrome b1)
MPAQFPASHVESRRMLEKILAVEEEHAEDMLDLLDGLK